MANENCATDALSLGRGSVAIDKLDEQHRRGRNGQYVWTKPDGEDHFRGGFDWLPEIRGQHSAGSGESSSARSSVFDAFKDFVGVTLTPAVTPTDGGASPFSLLSGISKPIYGTAATKSALRATVCATTDPSKMVFSEVGSRPKEDTAGSVGTNTGDDEYAANVKALNVAVAAWISEKVKENLAKKSSSKVDTKESTAAKPATSGFTFGSVVPVTTKNTAAAPSPSAAKRFSFGFGSTSSTPGTGFIFANVVKPTEDSKPDGMATADAKPCKVEFTPAKENDSIFPKRCKLFMNGKVQILVRADTSIGQILLNIMCVPTPETKPPPPSTPESPLPKVVYKFIDDILNECVMEMPSLLSPILDDFSKSLRNIRRRLSQQAYARGQPSAVL
ncbi:nucleoporin [Culex quinquefasciatus]|uniref:Nucleoporin n=1 Tax=Culex quinquefasciatus TaxID=7176 RepID=B0X947_CULQU|nr:nucleoporin [Culex quinquefasciatus]|eukprot:XP_001866169.1 nucleoporin [Culex quinquefasciatus]